MKCPIHKCNTDMEHVGTMKKGGKVYKCPKCGCEFTVPKGEGE